MAVYTYVYPTDFTNGINLEGLQIDIKGSSIDNVLNGIKWNKTTNNVDIDFTGSLSGGEVTTLNGLVASHRVAIPDSGVLAGWDPGITQGWEIREQFVTRVSRGHYQNDGDAGGGSDDQYELGTPPTHIGMVNQYRTAVGAAWMCGFRDSGQISFPDSPHGVYRLKWIWKTPQVATATDNFYLMHGLTDDPHFGYAGKWIAIRYHYNENSGNFRLSYDNGGATSYVNSSPAVTLAANTWYYCELECTQDGVEFFIDTSEKTRTSRGSISSGFPIEDLGVSIFGEATALGAPSVVLHFIDEIRERYIRYPS